MPEMKTLNGYEVVDAKAREDITGLRNDLPTKVSQLENDSKFITREEVPNPDLSEYITESELNAKLDPIEASIAAVEADCPETYFLDFSDATATDKAATEHMIKFVNKFMRGANTEAVVMMKTPSSQYYYPAIVSTYADGILMTPMALNPNAIDNTPLSWEGIYLYTNTDASSGGYRTHGGNTKTLVSKKYVDDQIANIDIPESTDLTGYATEEYVNTTVNTAVSNIPCVTEVIDVHGFTETKQNLSSNSDLVSILNRIVSGEKFPFCLLTSPSVHEYPVRLIHDSKNVVIPLPVSYLDRPAGLYLSATKYLFELSGNTWYGYKDIDEYLVRSYTEV